MSQGLCINNLKTSVRWPFVLRYRRANGSCSCFDTSAWTALSIVCSSYSCAIT